MITIIVAIVILLVVFGGGYGIIAASPSPNPYTPYGIVGIIVTLLILYLVFHSLLHLV